MLTKHYEVQIFDQRSHYVRKFLLMVNGILLMQLDMILVDSIIHGKSLLRACILRHLLLFFSGQILDQNLQVLSSSSTRCYPWS